MEWSGGGGDGGEGGKESQRWWRDPESERQRHWAREKQRNVNEREGERRTGTRWKRKDEGESKSLKEKQMEGGRDR